MLEITLQLEGKMSDEEIAEKMKYHFPDIPYETTFKKGKKLLILELNIEKKEDTGE